VVRVTAGRVKAPRFSSEPAFSEPGKILKHGEAAGFNTGMETEEGTS